MSQQDGFTGGFIAGTVFGSIVGGMLGVVLASKRLNNELPATEESLLNSSEAKTSKGKKRQLKAVPTEQSIEAARRGLEDKIAQLNEAIDDVRHQLSGVNGTAKPVTGERLVVEEPPSRFSSGEASRPPSDTTPL